jgi:uncharacterized Zn finger protein (UPF0148 family)
MVCCSMCHASTQVSIKIENEEKNQKDEDENEKRTRRIARKWNVEKKDEAEKQQGREEVQLEQDESENAHKVGNKIRATQNTMARIQRKRPRMIRTGTFINSTRVKQCSQEK